MRNGSVTLTENKGNVFSHKTKSDRTISPPPAFDNRNFFSCFLSENENRSPSGHSPIPSQVARSADDGIFQPRIIRRCLFSPDRPSAAVCRKNTNGEAPQAVRISRRSCPFAGNIKTVHHRSVKPDFNAFMGRARFSGNRQPANSSVPAIFDRPSPYRRVAMARPFKTTFPTRRPFTMNAPPPCLHRKKPSRKRIACFPSTVSFPPERAPPAAAALRPFAGTSRNKTGGRPFSPAAPSAG